MTDSLHEKRTSYYGKEVKLMSCFIATNDRQLGVCLRMLYAEKIQPTVLTVMNDKNKIEFHISISASDELMADLMERYEILIS